MKFSVTTLLKKILKYTGITIGSILLIMFLLPYLFPNYVGTKIKQWANSSITGELNFSKARLSFFNHFPSLTLTLHDASLKGSEPFKKDTLVVAKEIALGVNLGSIFGKAITIDEIYLTDGTINILTDKEGRPNYNIYVSKDTATKKAANDTSSASLKLARIQIDNCSLNYDDKSIPMLLQVNKLNYLGKGDLSKAIFDLTSNIEMEGAYINYDGQPYLENKKLKAELITKINTNSLSLFFEQNNLSINQLPIEFKGQFDFLKNGYNMDFNLKTKKTEFKNLFTAMPPAFTRWVEKRTIEGDLTMDASLKGNYIAEQKIAPTLAFNMNVVNGYMNSKKAHEPARDFVFDFHFKLPQLNIDSMQVDLDSLHLAIGTRFIEGAVHTKGLSKLLVDAHLKGELDLEKLNRVLGNPDTLDVKGLYRFNTTVNGIFTKGQNPKRLRADTIVTSIPTFSFTSALQDGYIKYYALPEAVKNVSCNINLSCKDNNYEHTSIAIDNINATALNNFLKGFVHISGVSNLLVDADIKTKFNLEDIKAFYPLKDIETRGNLDINLVAKGTYNSQHRKFPVTNTFINLNNGFIKTAYYPSPIQKIKVEAVVTSTGGTMKDLQVNLKPVSLEFDGKPFTVTSNLKNFDNLSYNVASKGTLDIGKIYKVFAVKGYDVKGIVKTDFVLSGTQADATAGRYGKLNNKGTVELQDIKIVSDLFPKPFLITNGAFHFNNDQFVADDLKLSYGSTNASLKGSFSNIINYALKDNEALKGQLTFNSNYLNADELMAFNADTASKKTTASTGVIIIPNNLDMQFTANANKVSYNTLNIANATSTVTVKEGKLTMNNTKFTLVDAPIAMDATYQSLSPTKANFSYHIQAKDFDIKKAYNQITLFKQMATSAASVQGIVSLDYTLSGVLNSDMYPILNSLKGGGTLALNKVKVKGMKLFAAVSKATNRDSMNNPSLAGVNIKTTIANNIITIERTKMKVLGFRPRFEGQVSFDGRLNLKARLGLPPFGIFGIPFSVTGTQQKPIIKLKRGSEKDELKPEEYDEDAKPVTPPVEEKKG